MHEQMDEQDVAQYWFDFVWSGLERNGPARVREQLIGQGWSREDASAWVEHVRGIRQDAARRAARRRGWEKVVGGAFFAILGAGITGATYWFAGPGEAYVVTWGLIVFGVIWVIVGLAQVAKE